MANRVVQFRRGTTAQTEIFTGAPGEITIDSDKWTAVVHDGHTAGGHPLRLKAEPQIDTRYIMFRAAAVQQGWASVAFSSPANNGPTGVVIEDDESGLLTGAAAFAPHQNQVIQDHFVLPQGWVVPLSVDILWRANVNIGSVIWRLETCCIPTGTILEENYFNAPQTVTTIAADREYKLSTSTIEINTTPFANVTSGELFFRLTRDGGSDTIGVPVELISLRFAGHRNKRFFLQWF